MDPANGKGSFPVVGDDGDRVGRIRLVEVKGRNYLNDDPVGLLVHPKLECREQEADRSDGAGEDDWPGPR